MGRKAKLSVGGETIQRVCALLDDMLDLGPTLDKHHKEKLAKLRAVHDSPGGEFYLKKAEVERKYLQQWFDQKRKVFAMGMDILFRLAEPEETDRLEEAAAKYEQIEQEAHGGARRDDVAEAQSPPVDPAPAR